MNAAALPKSINAEMQAIFRKYSDADCVGIYWPAAADGPQAILNATIEGKQVRVVTCVSELAMREQLLLHDANDARLVILSAIDTNLLGEDVLNQLWRRSLRHIDAWRTLSERLDLRTIDPRLVRGGKQRWFAEALLEVWPSVESQVNIGQVLDYNTAWLTLSRGVLGFEAAQLDIDTLFNWSLQPATVATPVSEEFIHNVQPWFEQQLQQLAPLIGKITFDSDRQVKPQLLLPLGLVAHVLSENAGAEYADARVRLEERYLQGKHPDNVISDFGKAAHRFASRVVLQTANSSQALPIMAALGRADKILAELHCEALAIHSDLLPSGHELQLERIAAYIQRHPKPDSAQLSQLETWQYELQQHKLLDKTSYVGIQRALALLRWLALTSKQPDKLSAPILMREYRQQGGFVDFARSVLWRGDNNESLSQAYRLILEQVAQSVDSANEQLASDMEGIARGDQLPEDLIYIEHALDQLIVPVAKQHPVLLLVMDGMSQAVWREFSSDLFYDQWEEYRRTATTDQSHTIPCSLVAALPTVTKVCRQSLLTGKLAEGNATDEEKGFATHPALAGVTTKSYPPVLFHKGKLTQAGTPGLSPEVRSVVADDTHRVVAVVINVVDDQLSSNDQLDALWSPQSLPVVRQLLDAVRESGRVLVLTSDHGHVRAFDSERGEKGLEAMDGRYKPGDSTVNDGEIALTGSRVVTEGNSVVLPWREKIRYANPKKGFHGGASLQEMVIPFGVYSSPMQNLELSGWQTVSQEIPAWWSGESKVAEGAVYVAPVKTTPKKQPTSEKFTTPDLFDTPEPPSDSDRTDTNTATVGWIDQLLKSAVLANQRKRTPRPVISDEEISALLACLESRGMQAGVTEISQATGKPRVRVTGFIAAVRKLLNVDGFDVLSEDKGSKTVRLNIQQLQTQFLLNE